MKSIVLEEKKVSNTNFLPPDVSKLVKGMVKLRYQFDVTSRGLAPPRVSPTAPFKPPKADVFPDYPIHTMDNTYEVDKNETGDDDCEKVFNESSHISGGLGMVTCGHKVTKGF